VHLATKGTRCLRDVFFAVLYLLGGIKFELSAHLTTIYVYRERAGQQVIQVSKEPTGLSLLKLLHSNV